jgi:DNA-binding CsgD family transcriptional regulator
VSDAAIEEFLDLLYAAPATGEWYAVAEHLGAVVGLPHVTLVERSPPAQLGLRAQHGFRYGDFEYIRDRFIADANAYIEALASQPAQRADPSQRVPPEEHGYLSLETHLRRSFGVTPEFGAILADGPAGEQFISIMRPADDTRHLQREQARFLTLLPHLRRAFASALALERRAPLALGFEAAIDALSAAVFLCDRAARVIVANDPARALLTRRDGVRLSRGVLRFVDAQASGAAAREIERAAARAPGMTVRFSARRGKGALPFSVTVSGHARGVAIVFVEDPERDMLPDIEALSSLAGLSPAQARAARLAASGMGIEAMAEMMGVSTHTARTHLRRAFHKLDCRDRRDLAVRLAALKGLAG